MKKIFSVSAVILLFLIAGLISWAAFLPKSFLNFLKMSSLAKEPIIGAGAANTQMLFLTSSAPILGHQGQVIIKGSAWDVEIADNDQARIAGLSNRKALPSSTGLLFVFPDLTEHPFWMKDMFFPVDMIFFADDWKVALIEPDLQPASFPKTFGSGVKSRYVLEINAGESQIHGLQAGDRVIFLNK